MRRVFDCVLYNGEIDVLEIRLHELDAVVERFIIVESDLTFSGNPKKIEFDPTHPRVSAFAHKIHHVVVSDMPQTTDPWEREKWQRNAMLRGLAGAAENDLIVMSDVDEIVRASALVTARDDEKFSIFCFRLAFYYFFLNYRCVAGLEANNVWNYAATYRETIRITPQGFRNTMPPGSRVFDDAGWHFSYLTDDAGVRKKISAFSHQELNTEAVLSSVDIASMVRRGADLYARPGYVWKLTDGSEAPEWVRRNRKRFSALFRSDRISRASTMKHFGTAVLLSFIRRQLEWLRVHIKKRRGSSLI